MDHSNTLKQIQTESNNVNQLVTALEAQKADLKRTEKSLTNARARLKSHMDKLMEDPEMLTAASPEVGEWTPPEDADLGLTGDHYKGPLPAHVTLEDVK